MQRSPNVPGTHGLAAFVASLLLAAGPSWAAPVAIVNPSFEADLAQVPDHGTFTFGPLTGWTQTGSGGPFNPSGHFPVTGVPDGQVVAWVHGGSLSQVLAAALASSTRYTLRVDVGDANNTSFPGFEIELWAGGTLLASASSPTPADGAFVTVTLTHVTSASDLLAGQPLEVRLVSSGVETDFDNVRLDAVSTAGDGGGRFEVSVACPATASRGASIDASVTFRNGTDTPRTLTRGAAELHAGELTLTGPQAFALAAIVPAATGVDAPGTASAVVPVMIPARARSGSFVSVGLGFFGRVGDGSTRKLLATERCVIEIVR